MKPSTIKKYLAFAVLATAMSKNPAPELEEQPEKPKRVVVPAGAKYYHFREDGSFETGEMAPDWAVFSCIARTDRAAIRKFNNYKK